MKIRMFKIESKLTKKLECQPGTSGMGKTVLPLALINEMLYTLYLSSFIYFVRTASHVNNLDQGRSGAPLRAVGLLLRTPDKELGEGV